MLRIFRSSGKKVPEIYGLREIIVPEKFNNGNEKKFLRKTRKFQISLPQFKPPLNLFAKISYAKRT